MSGGGRDGKVRNYDNANVNRGHAGIACSSAYAACSSDDE